MKLKLIAAIGATFIVAAACATTPQEAAFDARPPYDNLDTAMPIKQLPFEDAMTNLDATLEVDEPQPCAQIDKTVWYIFQAKKRLNASVAVSSDISSAVAVYEGNEIGKLVEVGCGVSGSDALLSFEALSGKTYAIQVGGAGENQVGDISVSMTEADQSSPLIGDPGPLKKGWVERDIVPETNLLVPGVPVNVDVQTPRIEIDGRPEADGFYTVSIKVEGVPGGATEISREYSLNARGKLTQPFHLEQMGVSNPGISAARLRIFYRYDPSQGSCELKSKGACALKVPVDPANTKWTTDEGPDAELIVMIALETTGDPDLNVLSPMYVRIPLLGQVRSVI